MEEEEGAVATWSEEAVGGGGSWRPVGRLPREAGERREEGGGGVRAHGPWWGGCWAGLGRRSTGRAHENRAIFLIS
jgi:hypothetical protein